MPFRSFPPRPPTSFRSAGGWDFRTMSYIFKNQMIQGWSSLVLALSIGCGGAMIYFCLRFMLTMKLGEGGHVNEYGFC